MNGTIKRLRDGFGFIKADGAPDHFFHHSEVRGCRFDELHEGDEVTFESQDGERGPRASDVYRA